MLVAWRSITRRAFTSQLQPSENPSVRLPFAAFMMQTRQATRLAAKDQPVDVKQRTKGENTTRPLKRVRKAYQPDERAPSVVATKPKELERKSQ